MVRTVQLLADLSTSLLAQAPALGVTLAGTEQRAITSAAIGQRYDLLVSLPEGYATSGKAYPVLYVLDGWHFPLMAYLQDNNRFSERMPPVIIVNINHRDDAMRLRARDFNPTRIENMAGSGGGAAFLAFLEGDIIPFVERSYRIIPTDRAILGHSLRRSRKRRWQTSRCATRSTGARTTTPCGSRPFRPDCTGSTGPRRASDNQGAAAAPTSSVGPTRGRSGPDRRGLWACRTRACCGRIPRCRGSARGFLRS